MRLEECHCLLDAEPSQSHERGLGEVADQRVHQARRRPDSVFSWLDRAVQERTHWLVWLRRDPRWERVRGDPRYDELVRRLNLPP